VPPAFAVPTEQL
jgi:hypothetical protein